MYVDTSVGGSSARRPRPRRWGGSSRSPAQAVTIGDFVAHYCRMLGRCTAHGATPVARAIARVIDSAARVRGAFREPPAAIGYFLRRGTYSIAHAREVLGYEPAVSLEEHAAHRGMAARGGDALAAGYIGAPGFEPGTSPTRTVRATGLRYAPK